jgi:hypothetical protein
MTGNGSMNNLQKNMTKIFNYFKKKILQIKYNLHVRKLRKQDPFIYK